MSKVASWIAAGALALACTGAAAQDTASAQGS